jgi:hypothetical protein
MTLSVDQFASQLTNYIYGSIKEKYSSTLLRFSFVQLTYYFGH